jgi:hypothetical protein
MYKNKASKAMMICMKTRKGRGEILQRILKENDVRMWSGFIWWREDVMRIYVMTWGCDEDLCDDVRMWWGFIWWREDVMRIYLMTWGCDEDLSDDMRMWWGFIWWREDVMRIYLMTWGCDEDLSDDVRMWSGFMWWHEDVIRIYLMTGDGMKPTAVVKTATKFLVLWKLENLSTNWVMC